MSDPGARSPATILLNWCYWAEHRLSMVLIEVMVNATDGEPALPEELELLNEDDSFPITATCRPK